MKILLLSTLTLFAINARGQQWSEHQLDSTLTITIPDDFKITETLGQKIFMAKIDKGLIIISTLPNTGPKAIKIGNEAELVAMYDEFSKGLIEAHHGKLIKEELLNKEGIKLKRFSYTATMEGEEQIRHCIILFLNNKSYAISFWEVESMTREMTTVRENLFSSIKFPPGVGLENQMSDRGSTAFDTGYLIGKMLGYLMIVAILIFLVIWISKKLRSKQANKLE